MRRRVQGASLAGAALALACDPAAARAPAVLQFEMAGGGSTTAMAWRDGDDVLVDASVFDALGMKAPKGAAPYSLRAAPGVRFSVNEAGGTVTISCSADCFAAYDLGGAADDAGGGKDMAGLVVNYDLSATHTRDGWRAGGVATAIGARGPVSADASFLGETGRGFTRLDTGVTIDHPQSRVRVRLGDAVSRAGAWGLAARFGGLKVGTDFSLDPYFVTFPTPALRGAAGLPSTVDVYVNGVVRETRPAAPGPFTITDAPYVLGAGVAHLVVTDLLGREQIASQSFYVTPRLLKAGLSDFTVDAGAERRNYGAGADRYGDAFGTISYRRGVAGGLTIEARGEAARDFAAAGFSVAGADFRLGEGEISYAHSQSGRGGGDLARAAWSKQAGPLTASVSVETASALLRRTGQDEAAAPDRLRQAASLGWATRAGHFAAGHVATESRDRAGAAAWNASYGRDFRSGVLSVSALAVTRPRSAYVVTIGFAARFGRHGAASASAGLRNDGAHAHVRAGVTRPEGGGFGWRAGAGDHGRYDLAARYSGLRGEISAEASRAAGETGYRAGARGAVALAGGALYAAREIRDSYALVEAAPGAAVLLDNRFAGRANTHGRLLIAGLRAYQPSRLSIDVDAAPIGMRIGADAMVVKAKARAGVRLAFDMAKEDGRWVSVAGPDGAPAPPGTLLTRQGDGAPFFVGEDGRAFVAGGGGGERFAATIGGKDCVVAFSSGERLTCSAL